MKFQSRARKVTSNQPSLKRKAVYTSTESEDDVPLASPTKQVKSAAVPVPGALAAKASAPSVSGINQKSNGRVRAKDAAVKEENDLSDSSFGQKKSKPKRKKPAKKKPKMEEEEEDDPFSEDDIPLATPKKATPKAVNGKAKGKAKAKAKPESDGDVAMGGGDSNKHKIKGKASQKKKDEDGAAKTTKKKKKEEEEEVFRWWDAPADVTGDGSVKWKTLEHNGVLFPPPYQLLPKDVKMGYEGACCSNGVSAF